MRLLIKVVLSCIGVVVSLLAVSVLWFRYYTRDLPDIGALAQYAPATVSLSSDPCVGQSVVIPYDAIGLNLKNALNAVGVREDDPSAVSVTYWGLVGENRFHGATLSVQISFTMFCESPSKTLVRQIAELRTAAQIEKRFTKHQIFTMYTNRMHCGGNTAGVQDASQFFFHKDADQVDIGQAALLAGLLRSPASYSPIRHPDRALRRRDEVIDAMVSNGSITHHDAEEAKAEPLLGPQ